MTSGVYKLTFLNGDEYIGKSINIESRWKQHFDKMQSGKAAKNMQDAYRRYGLPECQVLFNCHSDHIDLVEACYIYRGQPALNGTAPPDPFEGVYDENFHSIMPLLEHSTLEHINTMLALIRKNEELKVGHKDSQTEIAELSVKRSEEMIKADLDDLLEEKDSKIYDLEHTNEVLKRGLTEANKLLAYHNLPWYKKLF